MLKSKSNNSREVTAIKNKSEKNIFAVVLAVNLLLFVVKLYVGLSSNSISIYSDGINNFFDGLSSAASLVFFSLVMKNGSELFGSFKQKGEQLITFILSAVIVATGFIFLYNSAERLMYPTPVWFSMKYFYLLSATAVIKLVLSFFLKRKAIETGSEIIKVMSVDSLMDFFITAVTVITLYASHKGSFSFDACAGIFISVIILISGVKNLKCNTSLLLNYPEKKHREKIEQIISEALPCEVIQADFSLGKENIVYLKVSEDITDERLEKLKQRIFKETEYTLYLLK